VAGHEKNFTKIVATLVDTNILVYCYDPRAKEKQAAARDLLRHGTKHELCLPHQALVELVSVVTSSGGHRQRMLPDDEARRQAEELMAAFTVLYPNEKLFRTALHGMASYNLPWFDAHLWAYAEHYGLPEILSEDFEHGRIYGTVRIRNPFIALGLA
jgi:predicted nucleic acid-binding protein